MFKYSVVAENKLRLRYEFRKGRAPKRAERLEQTEATRTGHLYVVFIIGQVADPSPKCTRIVTDRATWDSSRTARPTAKAKLLIRELVNFEQVAEQVYHELLKGKYAVTGQMLMKSIRAFVDEGGDALPSLPKVFKEFLAAKRAMIERPNTVRTIDHISEATYGTYSKRWAYILSYLRASKQTSLPVVNVDYPFAVRFKEWMQAQQQPNGNPYHPATINKAISLLKQLLTYSLSKGYVKHNPLNNFSCRGGSPANPKPLTLEQLDHLETCELPITLRRFCDSWLVAAELCLHHADFMGLEKALFIEHNGRRYLQRKRTKQQGSSLTQTVDVTLRAERILTEYGGVKGLVYKSSAYYSKVLKQIAKAADLRDSMGELVDLQFGMGRDTGLTQRAIDGANSIQLCKMAGWSKPVYAERYIGGAGGAIDIVEAFANARTKKAADTANVVLIDGEPTPFRRAV